MIKAICHTNLDNYECEVTAFSALPRIGDSVRVLYCGGYSLLKVVRIIHDQLRDGTPIIDVELHN